MEWSAEEVRPSTLVSGLPYYNTIHRLNDSVRDIRDRPLSHHLVDHGAQRHRIEQQPVGALAVRDGADMGQIDLLRSAEVLQKGACRSHRDTRSSSGRTSQNT